MKKNRDVFAAKVVRFCSESLTTATIHYLELDCAQTTSDIAWDNGVSVTEEFASQSVFNESQLILCMNIHEQWWRTRFNCDEVAAVFKLFFTNNTLDTHTSHVHYVLHKNTIKTQLIQLKLSRSPTKLRQKSTQLLRFFLERSECRRHPSLRRVGGVGLRNHTHAQTQDVQLVRSNADDSGSEWNCNNYTFLTIGPRNKIKEETKSVSITNRSRRYTNRQNLQTPNTRLVKKNWKQLQYSKILKFV